MAFRPFFSFRLAGVELFQFLMTKGPRTRPMTRLTMKLKISILNIHITSFQIGQYFSIAKLREPFNRTVSPWRINFSIVGLLLHG